MGKIIKIVVVVVLVFLAFKVGRPWIESQGYMVPGLSGEVNTEGWACVRQVQETRDLCEELLRKSQPNRPIEFLGTLKDEVRAATRLCSCVNRGCAEGNEALAILSELTELMADSGRLGETARLGPARIEKVDEILKEAKAAAASRPSSSP